MCLHGLHQRWLFLSLSVCGLVLGTDASLAPAKILQVFPDGHGQFATIQDAVDAAHFYGDTVELGDGIFSGPGNVEVEFGAKNLVVRSASDNPLACTIDCNGAEYSFFFFHENVYTVQGIRFVGSKMLAGSSGPWSPFLDLWLGNCHFVSHPVEFLPYTEGVIANCEFDDSPVISTTNGLIFDSVFRKCQGGTSYGGGAVYSHAHLRILRCVFLDNTHPQRGGAVYLANSEGDGDMRIIDCIFSGNSAGHKGGAVYSADPSFPIVRNCTFYRNSAAEGSAITVESTLVLERSILAGGRGWAALWCEPGAEIQVTCSNVHGNNGGDWVGCLADLIDLDGNFSAEPCFCDADDGDFHLCEDSWCLPGQHPWGCYDQVGALPAGCPACECAGPVASERRTWSEFKTLYR